MTLLLSIFVTVTIVSHIQALERPHIILILADDLGYNDIGYHNPDIITPNLDRLAKEGIILEQNYVQPICTPSRSSLMTGMYPYLIGRQGYPISHKQPTGLTLDRRLMPDYLKEKGYATHMVGKWHLGFCKEEYLPTSRGFDTHYGMWGGSEDYYNKQFRHGYDFRDNLHIDLAANMTFSEDLYEERVGSLISNHALNNPSQPLFLFMSHQATHTPLAPPKFYEDMYPNIKDDARRKFSATATAMDDKIGSLVDSLKEHNMYENSVIIFFGDNGGEPLLGGGGNNWPLRGLKGTVWEGGVRTPALLHSPMLKTKATVDHLFHESDWLPTLYHLAGATEEEIRAQNFSGINQWGMFENPEGDSIREEVVVNLDDDKGVTFGALRQGRYKYVKNPGPWVGWIPVPDSGILVESEQENIEDQKAVDIIHLYDLLEDPEERNDLKFELPHIVDIMDARMEELKTEMVAADNIDEVEGGNQGGIWNTGWC